MSNLCDEIVRQTHMVQYKLFRDNFMETLSVALEKSTI